MIERMKKKLPQTIMIILACLIFVVVLLLLKIRNTSGPQAPQLSESLLTEVESNTGNPIQKQIADQRNGLLYFIQGSFTGEIKKIEGREDAAYEGEFVVDGDPLDRPIRIAYLNTLFLGTYEGSFDKDSTWKQINAADLNDELVLGENVLLQVDYQFVRDQEPPEYVLNTQEVMDTLIKEFNSRDYSYEIPRDFFLVGQGVGVVR